ncbi:MAG: 5'(3')-deoxyribonucleotidase [Bacteroidetes bacterium]|nr:MAG: 5'(3')-deoxyribonucleotidase [Bacteroidota bacterium]
MEKKRLLVDMDHVMADITTNYIRYYKQATGILVQREDLMGKPEDAAFPQPQLIHEFLFTPGFFRTAPVMEGSQHVMKILNQVYDVSIVSAAMEFPQSLREKYDWLAEHFPFITWQQIILCGSKKWISGDYMIDDHFKNLNYFNGERILFTATHNSHIHKQGYTRVNNWNEVRQLLVKEEVHSI